MGFVEAEAGSCRNCTYMIGILLGSPASFFACLSKISRELTRYAHQVGPHHLQIFDVRLKESHLVRRADFAVHKAGPGERAYVPKAAKLGRPKADGVPRCGRKEESAGPCCARRVKNSRRRKAATRKDSFDPDTLAAAISAAQVELEEGRLFGDS